MRTHRNGSLAQAMALLRQNQAAFVAQLGETQKYRVELESRIARIDRSLEEIKAVLVHQGQTLKDHSRILAEHSGILREHSQLLAEHSQVLRELPEILAQLPEAVRRKIGVKPKS